MRQWLINHKKNLILTLILLAVFGGGWQALSGKVAKALQATLIATAGQALNGRLQVESIDLSLLNWVRLRNVAIYDSEGGLIAQSPNVGIKFQLSNLLKGNMSLASIETIAVQEPEIWLKLANGSWNWQTLLTKTEDETATEFRGSVEFGEGTVHIGNEHISQTVQGVNGQLQFAAYPDRLGVDLKGRVNQAVVALSGNWGEGNPAELTLTTDNFDLASLSGLLPATQEIRLEKGIAQKVRVAVSRDAGKQLHYQAEGEFSALAVSGSVNIADGKGAFKADQSGIHFQDLNVLISGQQATGSGSVLLDAAAQTLNFNLSLPDIDAAALFGGLTVAKPFAVSLTITGPVNHPVMTGNFSSPEIAAGGLAVGGVSGAMSYEAGRLNLQQASGTAYQGQLTLAGVILTATESYELTASGSGMNSSALTDKDVQGPLDFTARVSGAGEAAVARGDFIIRNGKAYGISFQSLTGSFIKRGGATEIFDIAVNTPLGTLYPEQLSREALEKLSERNIPTSREEVKKAATDALIKRIFR